MQKNPDSIYGTLRPNFTVHLSTSTTVPKVRQAIISALSIHGLIGSRMRLDCLGNLFFFCTGFIGLFQTFFLQSGAEFTAIKQKRKRVAPSTIDEAEIVWGHSSSKLHLFWETFFFFHCVLGSGWMHTKETLMKRIEPYIPEWLTDVSQKLL